MAAGRADSYDQRAGILGGIVLRNRIVSLLRIVVPAIGLSALLLLVGQIYLAGLARQYGIAGIRIDRGSVVVEAPQYQASGSNGSRYFATAREARTPLIGSNELDMIDATLEVLQADGITYLVTAKSAQMNTLTEYISAPGVVDVEGSDGLVGTLTDVDADQQAEIVTSRGAVDLTLPDGTTIVGDTMVHDGKTQTFTFTNATVVVPQLPDAEEGALPDQDDTDDLSLQLQETLE